ncbi:MAG: hypothetical protein U1E73_04135 [Planctomycetota bacterium]
MFRDRKPWLLLLAVLAIGASSAAQVVPLATAIGLYAQAGAAVDAVAPGTDVSAGEQVAAATGSGSAYAQFVPHWDAAAVTLTHTAASVASFAVQTRTVCDVRHELWSARPLVGRFVVAWTTSATGTGTAACAVDLQDDGSVEATGSGVIQCALPAGPFALRVRVTTAANAGTIGGPWGTTIAYHGAANAQLVIRFEPTHCTATAIGGGCPGPQLAAVGNLAGGVDVRALCGANDDFAVLLLALDPALAAPAIAPACPVLAAPLGLVWSLPDTGHLARWSLTWPAGLGTIAFAAQVVAIDVTPFAAAASAASGIVCQ